MLRLVVFTVSCILKPIIHIRKVFQVILYGLLPKYYPCTCFLLASIEENVSLLLHSLKKILLEVPVIFIHSGPE